MRLNQKQAPLLSAQRLERLQHELERQLVRRDGFLAGYYAETRRRPDVAFYDSATGVGGAYQKAVADGADYVVGPLDRDQVGSLFSQGDLRVPVLALNRASRQPPAGSVSFSLSPEDEGVAAAEYIVGQKLRNVLILAGSDDSLRRTAAAFRERLQSRGGSVVDTITLGGNAEAIATLIATSLAKGPVDAIYFAARGDQARVECICTVQSSQTRTCGCRAAARCGRRRSACPTARPGSDRWGRTPA